MAKVYKTFDIDLDIKYASSNRSIKLTEDDTGIIFNIKISDSGTAVDLTECRVMAVFANANGTYVQDSDAPNGGGITVTDPTSGKFSLQLFTPSFTAGHNECDIQIYSGESNEILVTAARFNFSADRSHLNDNPEQSEQEVPLLIGLISQATEAEQKAIAALERAEEAIERAESVVQTQGDMTKSVYDTDGNGVVDSAEDANKLGGQLPSHFATSSALAEEAAERKAIRPETIGAVWGKRTTVNLNSGSWSNNQITVTVQGVTPTNDILVSCKPDDAEKLEMWSKSGVVASAQIQNSITFSCTKVPALNLTANIMILEGVKE